jgi:glycosyltransferase involved in cell wall biosynthesis
VALFTDSFAEANGIARLSREFTAEAARRDYPLLVVSGGRQTQATLQGSVQRVELRRSRAAFRLEHDLEFDPLCWRHYWRVRHIVSTFKPDVVHITGPSDVGQLGAFLGHRLSIPIVGSWHTNVHEYAALRLSKWLGWLPSAIRRRALGVVERRALDAAVQFYRIPRLLLAPNPELVTLLADRTRKPTRLMRHGVDARAFSPRTQTDVQPVRIGFVGRLSAEKRVRLLADLRQALLIAGLPHQFVVIGDGGERAWLERAMPDAEFLGVLSGTVLASAYASLDLFAFPSPSETFGLAVLEAMASGVAVLAIARGGPSFVVEHRVSGWLARNEPDFVEAGVRLVRDPELRARLAAGGRLRSESWSWPAVCDELYTAYADATWIAASESRTQLALS